MAAKSEVLPAGVLDALIEELTLRVFWKDTESRYLGCNQAFAHDAGLQRPAELVGRLDTELGWKDQAEAYRADDRHVMLTGVARLGFEEPQTTPDGRTIWLRTSKLPLRAASGEVVGVLGVYEDITERHELGVKLEERERHLRTLLDALPFMVWLKDEQSRFLAVNEPFARAAQAASPDALVGRTDLDLWPRELALAYRFDDLTVLRSGEAKLVEEPVMVAGKRTWSETYKAPMRHGARVTGTVGFSRDISERVERQEAAAWALEGTGVQVQVVRAFHEASLPFARRLELALACFEGMQGLRATRNATLVLPGEDPQLHCAAKTGGGLWTRGEPPGRGVTVVARCDDVSPPHGHYFVSLERGDTHFGTLVLDTEPSPSTHPARLEALHSIGESLVRAIDAERTAQLLLSARLHAEEASQAKSRFLATMSHEIRTPLNGILGMAQLLATGELDERERAQSVQTILSSGQVLLGLLNDILDLSKVEAGKLTLDAVPFVVPELLGEVRRLFHDVAQGKGLSLTATWSGAPGALVGDALRLRQMLSNLVSNAVKFTEQGAVRLEVRERAGDAGDVVLEWAVSDDGVGLPAGRIGSLFQPFSQLDGSATRRYGGSGLGLSIVRHLAEKMGGEVGVESVEGQGSRFWFTTRHTRAKVEPHLHAAPGALATYAARRVLVVEDNPINRLVAERMLRRHGVEVSSAADGLAAVSVLTRAERPDLVLMDCQMPELDGLEATRRVRAWEGQQHVARVPIVALTAGAYEEDRALTHAAGMDGFLSKPLDARALAEVLAQWLSP